MIIAYSALVSGPTPSDYNQFFFSRIGGLQVKTSAPCTHTKAEELFLFPNGTAFEEALGIPRTRGVCAWLVYIRSVTLLID